MGASQLTAQEEMLLRLKSLDQEENDVIRQEEHLDTKEAKLEVDRKALAGRRRVIQSKRRQYEFALALLNGELPEDQVPLPKGKALVASG